MENKPLDGIKVIDFSQVLAGPFCASLLGDFGADVIKVEPPEGDSIRNTDQLIGGASAYFAGINRNKRCIKLDLKQSEGREIFNRLIEKADVFLTNLRPDAAVKKGVAYEDIRNLNEKIIYCHITAFGEKGPRSSQPGMDLLVQAIGGIMGMTGEPDGPPVKVGSPITDYSTAFLSAYAITAALYERLRTGRGRKINVSLLDATVSILANYAPQYFATGVPLKPVGGGHPQLVPYQAFKASDRYFIVACLTEKFWQNLCRALNREDLLSDERFKRNADRVKNRKALIAILEQIFEQKTAQEWIALLEQWDVPTGPINSFAEIFDDPQIQFNQVVVEVNHSAFGKYATLKNPIYFDNKIFDIYRPFPDLGEHSEEVLQELGYTQSDIQDLIQRKVI